MARPGRQAYGEVLANGFGAACVTLAVVFAGFAVWHPFAPGGREGLVMAAVAAATAALFAGAGVAARRGHVPPERSHPLAAVLATLAYLNCTVQYALTGEQYLSINVILVMIATTLCLVDPRWTGALVVGFGVGWVVVVAAVDGELTLGAAVHDVVVGGAVAVLAIVVRVGTLRRLLETQAELRALSQRDELTGLLNRRGFLDAAQVMLDRRRPVRLWFLDVDDLKVVNDTQGHDVGDALLGSVAEALSDVFAGGVVARLSGDEFAVLEDHGSAAGLVGAQAALDARLARASRATGLEISVSTGTATAEPGRPLSELLSAADAAMYVRKQARRSVERAAAARGPAAGPAPLD